MSECHFCSTPARNAFFCPNCGKILPPCWDNLFLALGLPIAFDIDNSSLRHNYYARLANIHPDKFSQTTDQEQALAQECSAFLNKAYNTLRQPWLRAEYLLQLLHPNHAMDQNVDPNLLLEIMQWREQLDTDDKDLITLQHELKTREASLLNKLQLALANNNPIEAWSIIAQFRFLKRFTDDLSNKLFDK